MLLMKSVALLPGKGKKVVVVVINCSWSAVCWRWLMMGLCHCGGWLRTNFKDGRMRIVEFGVSWRRSWIVWRFSDSGSRDIVGVMCSCCIFVANERSVVQQIILCCSVDC